jgi:hypothetical protein
VFKVSRIGKPPAKILDRFVATGDDFFERLVEARLAGLSEIGSVCAQCRHRRRGAAYSTTPKITQSASRLRGR